MGAGGDCIQCDIHHWATAGAMLDWWRSAGREVGRRTVGHQAEDDDGEDGLDAADGVGPGD
jgi:hypothetical protein